MTQRTPSQHRLQNEPTARSLRERAADLRPSIDAFRDKAAAVQAQQSDAEVDAALVMAAAALRRIDATIAAIPSVPHRTFDEAPEYRALDDAANGILSDITVSQAEGLPGLQAKAQVILSDRLSVQSSEALELAQSLARDVLATSPGAIPLLPHPKATDWHMPPPGFMASPAIEPTHFALIPHALRVELDRLHCIAQREFDRQVGPDTAPERRERLRRLLKLDIFEAASLSGDAEILALGMGLDAVHARWRASLPAYLKAQARFSRAEQDAKAQGKGVFAASEAVRDEPGVREAMGLFEDIRAELDPICRKIWRTPARTPLGLAVKARASLVMIFACGEYEAGRDLGEDEDLNEQSVRQLIEACCAFAGVNWKGDLTDGTTLAVPPADPVERTYGLVEQIDLPAASIDELRTIHDRARSLSGVAYDMSCQAACRSGDRNPLADPFNAAGRFLHWLGDALTDVESRAADELQDRQLHSHETLT